MTKTEIVQELYDTEFVQKYSPQFVMQKDLTDDFIQEVWLEIMEIPEEKLKAMYEADGINGVRKYVSGLIIRTCKSDTSRAHYKLVRYDARNLSKKMINDPKVKFDETGNVIR